MSYALNQLRREDFASKYERKLLEYADREVMFERFMLGEKMDKTEALHTIIMAELFCTGDCEVENAIYKKINPELTEYIGCRKDVNLAFKRGCKNC